MRTLQVVPEPPRTNHNSIQGVLVFPESVIIDYSDSGHNPVPKPDRSESNTRSMVENPMFTHKADAGGVWLCVVGRSVTLVTNLVFVPNAMSAVFRI